MDYRNVRAKKEWLDEMLRWSNGVREVPVIVREGTLAGIGWSGFT